MPPKCKMNNMKDKLNIQLLTASVLSIGGLVLLFCGVFIEPEGQIHESLLIGFGEVATFAGSIMGVDYTYKHKAHHYDHPTNPPDQEPASGSGHAYPPISGGKPADGNA